MATATHNKSYRQHYTKISGDNPYINVTVVTDWDPIYRRYTTRFIVTENTPGTYRYLTATERKNPLAPDNETVILGRHYTRLGLLRARLVATKGTRSPSKIDELYAWATRRMA